MNQCSRRQPLDSQFLAKTQDVRNIRALYFLHADVMIPIDCFFDIFLGEDFLRQSFDVLEDVELKKLLEFDRKQENLNASYFFVCTKLPPLVSLSL